MTKSELIEILSSRQAHLKADDVDLAVKSLLEMMGASLSGGERIEIRGFGSFSLHYRPPRLGRNPKTGDSVALQQVTYTVRRGDTLSRISRMFQVSVKDLLAWNQLRSAHRIRPGQRLVMYVDDASRTGG